MMMITTFLPVVANNLPPVIGSFHFFAPIFMVSIIIFDIKVFLNKNIIITLIIGLLLIFVFPLVIWTYIDDWNINAQRNEFYFIFTSLITYHYYQKNQDFISYSRITYITIIFIGITAIMSIYSSVIDPMYARSLTGGKYADEELEYFKSIGGGTYGFANAILGLLPIGIFYFKNNSYLKFNSKVVLVYLVLIFAALIKMQLFGNILLGFIIVAISILGRKNLKLSLLILATSAIFALIIPREIYAGLLLYFSKFFSSSSQVYFKLTDMAQYLVTGESVATQGRAARYPQLFMAFLNSPFLGSAFKGGEFYLIEGVHLHWMNRLAIWGVFGFFIFVNMIYRNIKHFFYQIEDKKFLLFYLYSLFAILGYGLIKTIAGREVWFMLFFIIPGTYYFPIQKGKKLINFKL